MPTYLTLYNWTDQGIKNVKETVTRVDQATKAIDQAGGRILGVYWTQGRYDLAAIAEWPDEDTAMTFALQLGMSGNVHSETMRAFTRDDMQRILGKLP